MTYRKFTLLLCAIIAFLLCMFIVAVGIGMAANDDIEWHAGGYVTGNFAAGAGYSPGVGVMGEAQARWKFIEARLSGSTAWQAKHNASFGYTYGVDAELRGYVWRDLYLVGAYSYAGYESRFDTGHVWAKSGQNFGGGVGWANNDLDINVIIYNQEKISPNKVWFSSLSARFRICKLLWGMAGIRYMTFDQQVNGAMERLDALNCSMGLGVRW